MWYLVDERQNHAMIARKNHPLCVILVIPRYGLLSLTSTSSWDILLLPCKFHGVRHILIKKYIELLYLKGIVDLLLHHFSSQCNLVDNPTSPGNKSLRLQVSVEACVRVWVSKLLQLIITKYKYRKIWNLRGHNQSDVRLSDHNMPQSSKLKQTTRLRLEQIPHKMLHSELEK